MNPKVIMQPQTRRGFIQTTALASAAMAIPASASQNGAKTKMYKNLGGGHIGLKANQKEAIALAAKYGFGGVTPNLGELASGLAMISAVPADTRTIVVKIEIEYHKKARGELVAEGRASPPFSVTEPINSLATAEIKDVEGDIVASVKVNWRLSPKEGAVVK